MRELILLHLHDAEQLELLYRNNKTAFKQSFIQLFPEISDNKIAIVWYARLKFEGHDILWGRKDEFIFIIIACFIAGLIAKLPGFTGINEAYYYPRNISFIVLPVLSGYFLWKQRAGIVQVLLIALPFVIAAVYINLLPNNPTSDTLILACIHLPLLLWLVLGFVFVGLKSKPLANRLTFLKYNADLLIMTGLILLAGAVLTAITINLFSLINYRIEEFYFKNIGVWGLASAPFIATYLIQSNPHLVNKVPPILAKIFTPLVLIMLIIYLIAMVQSGKDPYNDREFLLIFNVLLIGVMAIILFSTIEQSETRFIKFSITLLFALSLVTIIVNVIALSAIVFRIATLGITPNRLAVVGGNLLILSNLIIVCYRLFSASRHPEKLEAIEKSIAFFLPFYGLWAIIVTFLFPFIFGFR